MPSQVQFKLIYWSVFQVIAVGYVLSYSCSALLPKLDQPWFLVLLTFAATFIINSTHPFSVLVDGTFPILPYIAYFLFGRVLTSIYGKSSAFIDKLLAYSLAICIIYSCFFVQFGFNFSNAARAELPMYALICCIILLVLLLLIKFIDFNPKKVILLSPLENVGKIAFSAYYLHLAIIYVFLKPLTEIVSNSMEMVIFNVVTVVGITAFLAYLETVWARYDYIFSLEQLLRKGSAKLVDCSKVIPLAGDYEKT